MIIQAPKSECVQISAFMDVDCSWISDIHYMLRGLGNCNNRRMLWYLCHQHIERCGSEMSTFSSEIRSGDDAKGFGFRLEVHLVGDVVDAVHLKVEEQCEACFFSFLKGYLYGMDLYHLFGE